ncbi:zinc-ribbon domain-containing protein [Actinoallomurus sp. NPDC052308]|uniref:zinc-ribbon domain-containing protein n=1 Tax=Actinoallomurus sp. NPDC052308 TaxID=3155530 RepID=UPI0034270A14
MIANQSHPYRTVATTSYRSRDVCEWECITCQRRWRTRVSRAVDNGCRQCTRNARVPTASVASSHPDLVEEFRANITTGRDLWHVTFGSNDRCRWECRACAHRWEASIANRARLGSGCPQCANRQVGRKLMTPLSVALPSLTREFRRNLTDPARTAETTPSCSTDRVEWQCMLGHRWECSVGQRYKQGSGCPQCSAAQRRSRFELEVGYLLSAATGLLVVYDHPVQCPGARGGTVRVDLYLPECDLLVDLDPIRWHGTQRDLRRDTVKAKRLANRNFVRMRPRRLPALPAETIQVDDDGTDPRRWFAALGKYLAEDGVAVRSLTDADAKSALAAAALAWLAVVGSLPSPSLASAHPAIALEFTTNLDRPGLTPALMVPGSNDRCNWRCAQCGNEWVTRPAARTSGGTGCPRCAVRKRGRKKATPDEAECLATMYPDVARLFVANLTNPGVGPQQLYATSGDRCRWTCPNCCEERIARVADAVRRSTCRTCGRQRMGAARVETAVRKGRVLAVTHPELAQQVDVDRTGRSPDRIPSGGRRPVWWRCTVIADHLWSAPPYSRTSPSSPTGCPICAGKRPSQ